MKLYSLAISTFLALAAGAKKNLAELYCLTGAVFLGWLAAYMFRHGDWLGAGLESVLCAASVTVSIWRSRKA
jgi:hypothetical protein